MVENGSPKADSNADVLVVFGITGDLARVMTFRSLYRLEQRGLLDCPIVGVAVDDWTIDQLVERARTSIVATGEQLDEAVFARFAARLSYVQGDFADDATYARVGAATRRREDPRVLPGDPAQPVRHGREGPRGCRAHRARSGRHREAVRPRPAVGAGPRCRTAPVHRRVAAVPHRPLPRQDGPRGDPLPPLREHDARARVESQLRRLRADHDGRGLRRLGPRPLLRSGRGAARRRRQPPHAGVRRRRDGGAGARRPRHDQGPADAAVPRDTRGRPAVTTSAGSSTGIARSTASRPTPPPRRSAPCDSRSRTGAGRASRSSSAPASSCLRPRPRCAWSSSRQPNLGFGLRDAEQPAGSARDPARPVDRHAHPAQRATRGCPEAEPRLARHGVRDRGRRGTHAVRGPPARRPQGRPRPVRPAGHHRGCVAGHAAARRPPVADPRVRAGNVGSDRGRRARRRRTAAGAIPGSDQIHPCTGRSSRGVRRPRTVEAWTIVPRSATSFALVGRRSAPSRRISPPTAAIGACRDSGAKRWR